MEVRIKVPDARSDEVYVADISLVSAILAANGDIDDLPSLIVVPELKALVRDVSLGPGGTKSHRAANVLFAGSGRQGRSRAKWNLSLTRAKELLAAIRAEGDSPGRDDTSSDEGKRVQEAVSLVHAVTSIRAETCNLARSTDLPVLAIGDGFRRSLGDLPTLVYAKAVSGLESLRWRIRGNIGNDKRCIWITFFVWTMGALASIEGMPSQEEIAIAIDP